MPKFDIRVAIKELAEIEWVRKSLPDFPGDAPGSIGTQSIEVPFAALRISSHTKRCSEYGRAVKHDHEPNETCSGYRIEPDIKRACWEIAKVRADALRYPYEAQHLVDNLTEDSLLLDTLAWVKERDT